MAKSKGTKPPKSRPASTSSLSQPQMADQNVQITAFSPDATLFAQLSQAVDRARLRVYASHKAGVMADFLLPEAQTCRAIAWILLGAQSESDLSPSSSSTSASSKKRKALARAAAEQHTSDSTAPTPHVALGMSDGTVLVYSPVTARVMRVLVVSSQDSSTAALISLSYRDNHLWGVTANGWVHGWVVSGLASASVHERVPPTRHFLPDSKMPMSLLTCGPSHRMLTAHHALALYDVSTERIAAPLRQFTGHATPITHAAWAGEDAFVSAAAEDRHLYYWFTHLSHAGAMLTLDAPAHRLVTWAEADGTAMLLVISQLGTANVYRLPREVPKAKGLATLTPVSVVSTAFEGTELLDAICTPNGTLRYARIVKGFKVVLDEAPLYEDGNALRSVVTLAASSAPKPDVALRDTQRYKEARGAAGTRAELPGHTAAAAALLGTEGGLLPDAASSSVDLHDNALQDGDINEPTLAQRLKALKVQRGDARASTVNEREEEDEDDGDVDGAAPDPGAEVPVGGASLASSLTQALHSGDHALLTSCLVHSDVTLIRATVRRISGPLAVRLLEACVDRLNRGGVKSKGALGSGRARGIVEWIHQSLTFHAAYLMSLPNLVARLSQLHHSLAARLASHERLLALKGRMELVMSQIDMHMSYTADEAQMPVQGQKLGKRSSATELEKKQQASQLQQRGQTWVEPDEDDDVEDIGLTAGNDVSMNADEDDYEDGIPEDMDEDELVNEDALEETEENSDLSLEEDEENELGLDEDDMASDDEDEDDGDDDNDNDTENEP